MKVTRRTSGSTWKYNWKPFVKPLQGSLVLCTVTCCSSSSSFVNEYFLSPTPTPLMLLTWNHNSLVYPVAVRDEHFFNCLKYVNPLLFFFNVWSLKEIVNCKADIRVNMLCSVQFRPHWFAHSGYRKISGQFYMSQIYLILNKFWSQYLFYFLPRVSCKQLSVLKKLCWLLTICIAWPFIHFLFLQKFKNLFDLYLQKTCTFLSSLQT